MKLDHIVHFIEKSPDNAVSFWREKGFHAAVGGRHLQWGTHNALLYLKDCYIEWLTVEKNDTAVQADHPLICLLMHDRQGLGTICLRTDDLNRVNARLKSRGFETSGILDAQRRTETGELIRWKMLFIKEAVSDELPSPFFIEWEESDAVRYEKLEKSGAIQASNKTMEIEKCVFDVRQPEKVKAKWLEILDGNLQLANCRIEFRKTDRPQERLEEVHFVDGEDKAEFEKGQYWLPRL